MTRKIAGFNMPVPHARNYYQCGRNKNVPLVLAKKLHRAAKRAASVIYLHWKSAPDSGNKSSEEVYYLGVQTARPVERYRDIRQENSTYSRNLLRSVVLAQPLQPVAQPPLQG